RSSDLRGKVKTGDVDATLCDRDRQPASAACQLEYLVPHLPAFFAVRWVQCRRTPGLLHIERNVSEKVAVQRIVMAAIAVEGNRLVRDHGAVPLNSDAVRSRLLRLRRSE